MSERIIVEVFGIKDQPSGGNSDCGCSGGCCGLSKTMGKMYDEFVSFLSRSNLRQRIDIKFVDVLMDDMDKYEYAMDGMNHGYALPLTAINGEVKFYGGISHKMIYDALRKMA
jgi:hypothetical protein